jgi:N-acetyl-gamma-glutamylphosphate reductase
VPVPVPRYGHEHAAVELQKTAVYGLTELYRDQVKGARLLANPGCYPTCSQVCGILHVYLVRCTHPMSTQ